MAEIAHTLHWSLAELMDLDVDELMAWHQEAASLLQRLNAPPTP